MTVLDITASIEIQGNVIIKQWDEDKNTYNILAETDTGIFENGTQDMEIKFMYAIDNTLVIEV
jgi:hypothetical protein